ncbi:MAG: DMT family transporter [Candidatus Marinimicrobia bacterium]|nr:DMT family transporter [Candidatus Neomarinimicrobiota bacterium]
MKNQSKAYIFTAFSILCWATVATAFKLALRYISPVQLLFVSTLSSLIVLFSLAVVTGKLSKLKKFNQKEIFFSALMGLVNPFGYYLVLFQAYAMLPAQIAQPLNVTWGIVIVFLSVPILRQKVRWQNFFSLVLAFLGVSLIAYGGEVSEYLNVSIAGILLALSTSVIWSLYWLINAKDTQDELLRLLLNFFFGAIYIVIFVLLNGSLVNFDMQGFWPAVYVGIFEMGLTFWFWLQALRYSENTARISIYIYIFPVLSMGIIYMVLGEKILFTSFIGLMLVITGVLANKILDSGPSRHQSKPKS